MEEFYKKVGERVQQLIEFEGVDIDTFANKCGIDVERVKKIINNKTQMTMDELVSISIAYDVSTDYIIGHFPLPLPAPSTESEYELYRKVSQMNEEKVVGVLKSLKEEKANLEDTMA